MSDRRDNSALDGGRCEEPIIVGCDFGSTTAKAVVLSSESELLYSCYTISHGNPIEDSQQLFRQIATAGFQNVGALSITGYGKDLLKNVLGADLAVVETVAHAQAAVHFFPDADVICDVGGCDVKIMILRDGTVSDFRLNSQCSSGNGAFLQGVAERYGVPLERLCRPSIRGAGHAAACHGMRRFLAIRHRQPAAQGLVGRRKSWPRSPSILPLNVWIYAGQLKNLARSGANFILQGGTHKNLAVVKTQVDFIRSKVPDAEIVVHPYPGEAGRDRRGAALPRRLGRQFPQPVPRIRRYRSAYPPLYHER